MCGIFGVYNHDSSSKLVYLGLRELQHRGQNAAGITSLENKNIFLAKNLGLVHEVFNQDILNGLPGKQAIGHVRYPTNGPSSLENVQPITRHLDDNQNCAIVHNGNLTNANVIRTNLLRKKVDLKSTSDSELFLHYIDEKSNVDIFDQIIESCKKVTGAYSFILLYKDEMYVARDPNGYRPLCLGKTENTILISSESHAFNLMDGKFIREVLPGEIIKISKEGLESRFINKETTKRKLCVFEKIYFSRPDSYLDDVNIYSFRKDLGRLLANKAKTANDADVVIPVPDSGVPAAIGYSQTKGIPYEVGLMRNHHIGRTFIGHQQKIRDFNVKMKLRPIVEVLKDKKIILIDDSLVRGTTARKIINMIREAGAKEIHMKLSCPPIISPCYYGINTPSYEELIASKLSVLEIAKEINVDSLEYLSYDSLLEITDKKTHCFSCFTNSYNE